MEGEGLTEQSQTRHEVVTRAMQERPADRGGISELWAGVFPEGLAQLSASECAAHWGQSGSHGRAFPDGYRSGLCGDTNLGIFLSDLTVFSFGFLYNFLSIFKNSFVLKF